MAKQSQAYHFIYKTTCLVTGRYYIGMHSTSNLDDNYLGSGKKLWHSINYHGKENHKKEILEFLPDRKSLAAREMEIVNEDLLTDSMCMNLVPGGQGWHGFINEEHQLKCSAAGGLTNNPEKSRKASERLTQTNLLRIQEGSHKSWSNNYSWTGRAHKPETLSKIGDTNSLKQRGSGNSQFGTKWMVHPVSGPVKVKAESISEYLNNGYVLGRSLFDK